MKAEAARSWGELASSAFLAAELQRGPEYCLGGCGVVKISARDCCVGCLLRARF